MHLSGLPGNPIMGVEVRDSVFTNARTPASFWRRSKAQPRELSHSSM